MQPKTNKPRKLKAGIYVHQNEENIIIVAEDGTYHLGKLKIRNGKYKYGLWRDKGKVKNTYLGKV